ncbi:MAG: HAD domain-containing protein [Candidatus Roizmanbacteria bacterium]|nr:HAD domain-containing protein [Candidatus Roizmanbacteria bacterium]
MNSVLFLDIDGVLNSRDFAIAQTEAGRTAESADRVDPVAVAHLQRIIQETNCYVSVSSVWRMNNTTGIIARILMAAGMDKQYAKRIVGLNPIVYKDVSFSKKYIEEQNTEFAKSPWSGNWYRGYESAVWLLRNRERYNISRFAIVDDDSDMWHMVLRFVHTPNSTGLTEDKANQLIQLLNTDSTEFIERLKSLVYEEHL